MLSDKISECPITLSPIETRIHGIRNEVSELGDGISRLRARTQPIRLEVPAEPSGVNSQKVSTVGCQLDDVLEMIESEIRSLRYLLHSIIDEFQI